MANPQKEEGFTSISNEIMEALAKFRIPGEARQMLDVVIRKTYGYNKKIDQISTSQFCHFTGLKPFIIHRARKRLLLANLITVSKNDNSQILSYSFQKDYDKWMPLAKKHTLSKIATYCKQKSAQTITNNDVHNINKDNIQNTEVFKTIINHLNTKANKNYRMSEASLRPMRARFSDGYVLEDFLKVINTKTGDWLGTDWEKFLRPETLFGNKFEGYLNQNGVNYGQKRQTRPFGQGTPSA